MNRSKAERNQRLATRRRVMCIGKSYLSRVGYSWLLRAGRERSLTNRAVGTSAEDRLAHTRPSLRKRKSTYS